MKIFGPLILFAAMAIGIAFPATAAVPYLNTGQAVTLTLDDLFGAPAYPGGEIVLSEAVLDPCVLMITTPDISAARMPWVVEVFLAKVSPSCLAPAERFFLLPELLDPVPK